MGTTEPISTADAGEMLSDFMQADAVIVWDRRGELQAQLTIRGMTREDAISVLRRCADDLEKHVGDWS